MFLQNISLLLLVLTSGTPQSHGPLHPGGALNALDGITIVANTPEFEVPRTIVVERVEPEDRPRSFPSTEERIAPFYRFSSDTTWHAGDQGLETRVPLPEGVDAGGLALQAFIPIEEILHATRTDIAGYWVAVPASYDPVTHEAVFKLRVLRPEGFYVTFSSGNFRRPSSTSP